MSTSTRYSPSAAREPTRLDVGTVTRARRPTISGSFCHAPPRSLEKDYQNYYAEQYPSITPAGKTSMEDKPDDDVFRITRTLHHPGFLGRRR